MRDIVKFAVWLAAITCSAVANAQFSAAYIYQDTQSSTAGGVGSLNYDIQHETTSGCQGSSPCYGNTAFGSSALTNNSVGSYNTAIGSAALFSNDTGTGNTGVGQWTLQNFEGNVNYNTAVGFEALSGPFAGGTSTGANNTAVGAGALGNDTSGANNTAAGFEALHSNTSSSNNVADGYQALYSSTTGSDNTAAGFGALYGNTSGSFNVASGAFALSTNSDGRGNTAAGVDALYGNTSGNYNTASGYQALYGAGAGAQNTALGANALFTNKDGAFNTAVGVSALQKSANGKYNVAVGWEAGYALSAGSYNIDIGNPGEAADTDTIRIGVQGTQKKSFLAGVYNVPLSGSAVVITSTGQLGVSSASSERFKTAITPMGSNTAKLEKLRPVTYRYKTDPNGALQYGLIAEEVANVFPELVIRDASGRIDGVRYDELAPLLLKVVQMQQQELAAQRRETREIRAEVRVLRDAQHNRR